jgi:hypothetical protein
MPNTTDYLYLALAVSGGVMGSLILSLWWRLRATAAQIAILREGQDA